jgi:hypothetical protein
MAKLGELTGPVMRSTTRLQRYRATRMGCKEIQKLCSTDPLAEYRSTPLIRSVNVKDVLGDIQTDYDNFPTRTPPSSGAQHLHFGTSMPSGGVHPIINCW